MNMMLYIEKYTQSKEGAKVSIDRKDRDKKVKWLLAMANGKVGSRRAGIKLWRINICSFSTITKIGHKTLYAVSIISHQ